MFTPADGKLSVKKTIDLAEDETDLVALAARFHQRFHAWSRLIESSAISEYSEVDDVGIKLYELRKDWGLTLQKVKGTTPRTVAEAHAKVSVAETLHAWTGNNDLTYLQLLIVSYEHLQIMLSKPDEADVTEPFRLSDLWGKRSKDSLQ